MNKYVSSGNTQEDIKHYQKLLIPLNIVVCVLCLVSIFTMMFVPFLRVDIGKIVSNQEVSTYIKEQLTKNLNGNNNHADVYGDYSFTAAPATGDTGSGNGNQNAGISDDMISAISTSVVDPLLQSVGKSDISLNLTAFSSLKVLTGGSEALKNELVEMVMHFADGVIDAINNLFKDGEIVTTIVEVSMPAIINASIEAMKNDPDTSPEIVNMLNNLTEQELTKLTEDLKKLQTTQTPEQFVDKIVEIAPNLMLTLTGNKVEGEQLDELRAEVQKMVDEQVEAISEQYPNRTYKYNLETFMCVKLSQSLNIEDMDKLIEDLINGKDKSNAAPSAYALAGKLDGEDKDGSSVGDSNGSSSGATQEKTNKLYLSFSEILTKIESTSNTLGDTIKAAVYKAIDDMGNDIEQFAQIYGLMFIFFAVFMLLWFILFLFSLLHIFAKNKRFMMWYVKLLCWIPGIIWLVLTLASMPSVITMIAGAVGADLPVGVITAIIGGISSWGTGISFICYWILWLISIFWAFPIKHKIRKLKKQAKLESKQAE